MGNQFFMSSLIETLIATFILACSMLGILAAENAALARTYNAYLSTIAGVRLVNISERFATGVGKDEFISWDQENLKLLPHSHSTSSGSKTIVITLFWQPRLSAEQQLIIYASK